MPVKQRRRRKDARPSEIIEAGFQEFSENGFVGTRLDDVAARAGIAKGTLYLYFNNKEALFEAAVRSRITPLLGRITRLVEFYPGPTRFLLRILFRLMHRQIAAGELQTIMRIMIAEGHRFPELTKFYYEEFMSKMMALLETIVARGVKRGELRAGAATDLPFVIISPGVMAAIWSMTFQPHHKIPADKFIDAHIDLVMNGISAKKED